jgi:hypothetical protein
MNKKNEGKEKKTFNLMVQGDNILLAKLSNPKSNHNSNFFLKTLNMYHFQNNLNLKYKTLHMTIIQNILE